MDTISRVRAEIERRWEEAHSKYKETADQYYDGMCTALDHLESFLDTLEEPDNSLEEEVKNYFQGFWPGTETAEQCNTDLHFTPPAIIRLARHFAQWGAEHLKK